MPFKKLGYRITSPYGERVLKGVKEFHDGIDLAKSHKAEIGAFIPGEVLYAGNGVPGTGVGGYGNVVVIKDKNGRAHVYAHLDSVSVKKGDAVKQNQIIGRQGATGKRVTGSHLHYEIRKKSSPSLGWVNDPKARTLDPTKYLKEFYAAPKQTSNKGVHVVKAGDTLWDIAKANNTTVLALKQLNGLNGDLIRPGDEIKLPGSKKVKKEMLHLPKNISSWRVYPTNVAPVKGNEKGFLNPKKFGGLKYEVLDKPQAHVVTIKTKDFGVVNIYVHPSTGAIIK